MITLVNCTAGSRLYGTHHDQSDHDTMGIFIAPKEDRLGLNPTDQQGSNDHAMYELTKFVRLACGGNPTILQLLYAPKAMWLEHDSLWSWVQKELRTLCVSQKCRPAFLGYLQQQRTKMLSGRQQRPDLIAKHGYDTKFAAHMIRLGIQGIEVLENNHMNLPMDLMGKTMCKMILAGQETQEHVLEYSYVLEHRIKTLDSPLPVEPEYDKVNDWLAETYLTFWEV